MQQKSTTLLAPLAPNTRARWLGENCKSLAHPQLLYTLKYSLLPESICGPCLLMRSLFVECEPFLFFY